jgi:hypothetical protein
MSPKPRTSVGATIDPHCQHSSPKGNRCHMLIDEHHRPSNGAERPALCAYHVGRLKATVPAVDPEILAAELLGDIDSFTTTDAVNLFLGNLVKQLARKRIARRDAIALAYISQLLLTSQTAMAREAVAEKEAEDLYRNLVQGLSRSRSSSGEQQSPDCAAAACPGAELAGGPGTEHARRAIVKRWPSPTH